MKPSSVITLCMPALIGLVIASPVRAEDVDGLYRGTYSNTGACSGGGATEMTIKDRTFTRRFGPNQQFDVTVAPDGSVAGQYGQSSLSGTVKGGHADLDIASARGNCRSHQALDKS